MNSTYKQSFTFISSKVVYVKKHLAYQVKHPLKTNFLLPIKLASLAKWLSVRLRTTWFWVGISLLSLKLQVWCMLRARSSLTFRQTIGCGFTLKLVHDMITYSQLNFPNLCQIIMLAVGAMGDSTPHLLKRRLQKSTI